MTAQRLIQSSLIQSRLARGFGLIELMIGMPRVTFLLLGLSEVLSASRTAYNTAQGTAEVQENGRFALQFLERDTRMAGHMGCVADEAALYRGTAGVFLAFHCTAAPPYIEASYATVPYYQRFDLSIQGFEAVSGTRTTPATTLTLPVATAAPAWTALPWKHTGGQFACWISGTRWNTGTPREQRHPPAAFLRHLFSAGHQLQSRGLPDHCARVRCPGGRRAQWDVRDCKLHQRQCLHCHQRERSRPDNSRNWPWAECGRLQSRRW